MSDQDMDELSDRMAQMSLDGGARPKQRRPPAPQADDSSDSDPIDEEFLDDMRQIIDMENEGLTPEQRATPRDRLGIMLMKSWGTVNRLDQQRGYERSESRSQVHSRLKKKGFQRTPEGQLVPPHSHTPSPHVQHVQPQNPNQPIPPPDPDHQRKLAERRARSKEWSGMKHRRVSPIHLREHNLEKARGLTNKRRDSALRGELRSQSSDPNVEPVSTTLPRMLNVLDEDERENEVEYDSEEEDTPWYCNFM